MEARIAELEARSAELRRVFADAQGSFEDFINDWKRQEEEVQRLRQELAAAHGAQADAAEAQALREELAALRSTHNQELEEMRVGQQALQQQNEQLTARQAVLTAELEDLYKERLDLLCQLRSTQATKQQHADGLPGLLHDTGAVAAPKLPAGLQAAGGPAWAALQLPADQPPAAAAAAGALAEPPGDQHAVAMAAEEPPQLPADHLPAAVAAGPAGAAPQLLADPQPNAAAAAAAGQAPQLAANPHPVAAVAGPAPQLPADGQPGAAPAGAAPQLPADGQPGAAVLAEGRLSSILNNFEADVGGPFGRVLCLEDRGLEREDLRKASQAMKGVILTDAGLHPQLDFERAVVLASGLSPALCPVIEAPRRQHKKLRGNQRFEISRQVPAGGDTPQLQQQISAAATIFDPQGCTPTDSLTLQVQYSDGSQHSLVLVRSQGGDIVVADA